VRTADGLHDLLLRIGDLTHPRARGAQPDAGHGVAGGSSRKARRVVQLPIAGDRRYVAIEDVARYRDALGIPVPPGVPESLLEPVRDPAGDLARRYARSHGPFTAARVGRPLRVRIAVAETLLRRLTSEERLIEGEFRPGGTEREWVDGDVLRSMRRRSLARLRQEVEPVDAEALGRFAVAWHGVGSGRRGHEALLDVVEQLQGAALRHRSSRPRYCRPRIADYQPSMLDTLMAAGEVVWAGVAPLGARDGRIALYLTDHAARLREPSADRKAPAGTEPTGARGRRARLSR
jgi:ATP-dependent Lhr-like helicase